MLLFHIPNGGTRNAGEAANLKLQGVRAGVPDLFFAKASGPFHGLFIEMKSEKGKIRDSQRCMMALFEEQDYHAAVCYSWEEAKDKILWYLSLNDQPSSTLEGRIFP